MSSLLFLDSLEKTISANLATRATPKEISINVLDNVLLSSLSFSMERLVSRKKKIRLLARIVTENSFQGTQTNSRKERGKKRCRLFSSEDVTEMQTTFQIFKDPYLSFVKTAGNILFLYKCGFDHQNSTLLGGRKGGGLFASILVSVPTLLTCTVDSFCRFIFSERFEGWTFLAYNLKGFDGTFVLRWLVQKGIKPKTILNGTKIMCLNVPSLGIRMIDSINFVPLPLKLFPKTFGLEEMKKGWFPRRFNKPENQNYVEKIPNVLYYDASSMKDEELKDFLKWHEKQDGEFDFQKELLEYCRNDVDILTKSMLKFREDFIDLENIDPLRYVTIASVCTAIFLGNYMKEDTLALNERVKTFNHSKESIEWLSFLE